MPDTTPTTPTETTTPPAKTRRPKQPVDQKLIDEVKRGEDVAEGLANATVAPLLADEGVAPTASADLSALCVAARGQVPLVITATQVKESATADELAAYKPLMTALRQIQQRAKRKFSGDAANQKAYLIGKEDFGDDRTTLEQDAESIISRATADNLPGMTADKLTAATAALTAWKVADAAQTAAIADYGNKLKALEAKVREIFKLRRDIQIAADTALPFSNPLNAANRGLLKLPANMPYNPGLGPTT